MDQGRRREGALGVLAVHQGRASAAGVQGHANAEHALRVGLDGDGRVDVRHEVLRPFSRAERLARTRLDRAGGRDLGPLRWALARARAGRQVLAAAEHDPAVDVAHVTTHVVALSSSRLLTRLPAVLSVDVGVGPWQRLLRGLPPDADVPVDVRPLLTLERRVLRAARAVQAWTQTVADELREAAPGARVVALHPGVDLQRWRPDPAARRGDGPVRVLFVGGRFEAKGGPELLEALGPRLGADVHLDLVTPADVPAREGVAVHRLSGGSPELRALFAGADVFCLPTRADAVPWVVLEAMASGVPVVAGDVGSVAEMVGVRDHRPGARAAGAVVEPGDVAGLRAALDALVDDPSRRRALGETARARCESFYDLRRSGDALVDLLHDVARPAGGLTRGAVAA